MSSPFQKGFIDKSPIDKKLVGKQNRLPEELKAKILATPEDSPVKQKIVGENTGEIKKDKKGKYALRLEDSVGGKKGDTIRIPKKNKKLIKDGYLMGGDYNTKKTGEKSFELTDSPLDQAVDLGIVKSNYKDKEFNPPFPGREMYQGTGDYARYKGKYTPEMLEMNRTYTQKYNEANVPGYKEMKRKQLESENKMTKEQKLKDDY